MKHTKLALFSFAALSLGGCDFMQNNVGKYLPTIGEPCNNWQCVTTSGQAQSEMNRREREHGGSPARMPLNGEGTAAPAASAPAPAAKSPTPFDMTPEQLGEVPNPNSGAE